MIPREKIDDVRERTSLVDVVRRHVELRRAGTGSWKGLCPFHAEKTPSFHVHEARQFFYCFGCGEKGDVFSFLTRIEQRPFMEVLRDLAKTAGVDLPEKELSPLERHALSEKELMLRAVEVATAFFEMQLAGPAGATARAYVARRGIGAEVAKRFRLGYAPAGWDALCGHLAARDVSPEIAERAGLIRTGDRGRYDFFRDRVMLPVLDRQKRPVGFSSRLLDENAPGGKYVNSPDSPLFHKKEQLYGLHAALEAMRRKGRAVIVEGNFDVLSLHEAGIEEAVAPMGTALTAEQVAIVSRAARQVILVFDGDEAGARAAEKAIDSGVFFGEQTDTRVALLPSGQDPDDFVRAHGAEGFERLVDGARPMLDHLIHLAARDATIPGRAAAVKRVVEALARTANPIQRDLYVRELAGKTGVPVHQVTAMLRQHATPAVAAPQAQPAPAAGPRRTPPRDELEAVVLLTSFPGLAKKTEANRVLELLIDPGVRQIYRASLDALASGQPMDVPAVLDAGPPDVREAVGGALMQSGYADADVAERAFLDLARKLERARIDAEAAAVERQYQSALATGDREMARAFAQRVLELKRAKQGLNTPA